MHTLCLSAAATVTDWHGTTAHGHEPGGVLGDRKTSLSRVLGSTNGDTARHRMLKSMGGLYDTAQPSRSGK
jgi:hypothetical protein